MKNQKPFTTEYTGEHRECHSLGLGRCNGLADVAFGFFQSGGGLRGFHAGSQHDHGNRGAIAAGLQRVSGGIVVRTSGLFEDAGGALDQLLVLSPHVDHEVAIDVAEPGHGAGRDHVEDHLVGGTRLHAGGSGQDFGADLGDDGEMRSALQRGIPVTGESDGVGTAAAGVFDGGNGEGSASAGGDTEDDVVFAGFAFLHFRDGGSGVIFTSFGGFCQGLWTAGHHILHGAGTGVEGGGNLGGVEGAETAAGSGADVDETSTLAKAGGDHVDSAGNLRQGAANCDGGGGVLVVDEADDFERGHAVEVGGGGEDLFGGEDAEIGSGLAGSGQVVRLSVCDEPVILIWERGCRVFAWNRNLWSDPGVQRSFAAKNAAQENRIGEDRTWGGQDCQHVCR